MISKEEALRLVKEHVKNPRLVKHMIAVSSIMQSLAKYLEEDIDLWKAVGMLHDIDYEITANDFDRHGIVSAEMLTKILPEEALHAIKAHNSRTSVQAKSQIDIALIAADALSGLIVATALMMLDQKVATVKVQSLMRKFKDGSFARSVSRDKIKTCVKLGLTLEEFLTHGLQSMQSISIELDL